MIIGSFRFETTSPVALHLGSFSFETTSPSVLQLGAFGIETTSTSTIRLGAFRFGTTSLTIPVLTLQGSSYLRVGVDTVFVDPGAIAVDTTGQDISLDIVTTGVVNTAESGTYLLFYNVIDSAGNPANEISRTVDVVPDPENYLGGLPLSGLTCFSDAMTGRISEVLMKLYYQIVDGSPYGVMYNPVQNSENGLVGRFLWNITMDNGTFISEKNHAEFTFAFAKAVTEGARLPGATHEERERYLLEALPLTFNVRWCISFNI